MRKPVKRKKVENTLTLVEWQALQDKKVQKAFKAFDEAQTKSAPINIRKQVLDTAERAVNGSRDVAYGTPENNFQRIANLWNAHLLNRNIIGITHDPVLTLSSGDVAIMLGLVKDGRLAGNMGHLDSWIDKAGYAACGAEVTAKDRES